MLKIQDNVNGDGGIFDIWGFEICYFFVVFCNLLMFMFINGNNSFCVGENMVFFVNGILNDVINWQWYIGLCGGILVGFGVLFIVLILGIYYVCGEGGCVILGSCQLVIVIQNLLNIFVINFGGVFLVVQLGVSY